MGPIGSFHLFPTFWLKLLGLTFVSYHLKVIDQVVYFLFPGSFVGPDLVDGLVDSLLSLFIVLLLGPFHVHLDGLGCLHSQIIFDNFLTFVDFWDDFVFVQKSELYDALSTDVLAFDAFAHVDGLNYVVVPVQVTHFSVDGGDVKFEDIVFGDSGHQLEQLDSVLFFVDFFPHVSEGLAYFYSFNDVFWYIVEFYGELAGHDWNDSTEGVGKGLIQGLQFFDEVEVSILYLTDFCHQVFVMVVSKSKGVKSEDSQIFFVFGFFQILLKCFPDRKSVV